MTTTSHRTDRLILAPVGPEGLWHALRALRAGVRVVAGDGAATTTFMSAFTEEGGTARDSADASVLAVGVRIHD